MKSQKLNDFLELHIRKPSRRNYDFHIREFASYTNITDFDTYLKDPRKMTNSKRIEYEDKIKKDILKYWRYINEESNKFHGKTPYVFISALKGLLESQNIVFPQEFYRNLRRNGNGNYAITNTKTPTQKQLKKILIEADTESFAFFMVQMTSGQRINRILDLRWQDIELEHEFPRLYFRKSKGKRPIRTRITPEAKEYLLQYKEKYDNIIKTRENRSKGKRQKPLDRDKVFPMAKSTAEYIWNNLTKKAGLYILDPVTNVPQYGTHCLRRYFISNFGDEQQAKYFAGKATQNDEAYHRLNDEQLDKIYAKSVDNLYVFKEKSETATLVKEQQIRIEDLEGQLDVYKSQYDIYKKRLKSQENKLQKIEKLLQRRIYDDIDPFDGPVLTEDENQYEDELEDKAIIEKERKLKKLIATDPIYKDSEIIYIDRVYNHDGTIRNYGTPYLTKKQKKTSKEDWFMEMNKQIALNALINMDNKEQQHLIKKANKEKQEMKQSKTFKQIRKQLSKQNK